MIRIDSHAHVFFQHDQSIAGARYTPQYDATADCFIAHLDQYAFTHGVLVQPSFLGTDNQVMLEAIQQYPQRLKGIAVVDTAIRLSELEALKQQGIVGIRLNLFGLALPALQSKSWQDFLGHLASVGFQVELHAPPHYLIAVLPVLNQYPLEVVIDHFGRVDPAKGVQDPAYQTLLNLLDPAQHWIKVSGFYRLSQTGQGIDVAQQAFQLLKQKQLLPKMVWGSDWPHTQHETVMSYAEAVSALEQIIPDAQEQALILGENAQKLFKF